MLSEAQAVPANAPAAAQPEVVLEIKNLTKKFPVAGGRFLTACDHVSLKAYKGQTLAIVGESGCGKSTLVRTIMQIYPATAGEVIVSGKNILDYRGDEARLNRRHIQMVFQDPSTAFDPKMLIKDILTEPLKNFGLIKNNEVDAKAEELLKMVELPVEFKDRYQHNMSGGQRQRVGIARALALEPEIVVCDEATSALDVSVQDKVCRLLAKLQKEKGTTILFICHDLSLVHAFSHKCAVMYLGNLMEYMDSTHLAGEAKHPYTLGLMHAIFKVDYRPGEKIQPLTGDIPSPLDLPQGCPFQSRCAVCEDKCKHDKPVLREIAPGHLVACHRL